VSAAQSEPPAPGLAAYRRVFARPHVLPLVATSVVARIPGGMGAVALILYVHGTSGSFGAAGIVAGAFTVGLGLTGPLLGRLIDRRGSRLVLVPGAVVGGIALAALVALGDGGAGTAALAAAAFLAGAATPPVNGVLRQRWPDLVGAADLPTAYACDAILLEAIFIAGPLLAGLLAATAGPATAVLAAGALGAIGTVFFARLGTIGPAPHDGSPRHWLGALASPRLRLLVFAGLPLGGMFGALDVALPAFGAHHGAAALGGPYAAALAFGSALGGIAYGTRPGTFGPASRALPTLAGLMALLCLPVLVATSIPAMFFCAAVAGLCVAPLITARNQLVHTSALAGTGTEAFTWLALSVTLGASLGSAVAGPLVEAAGWRAAAVLACALPAVATIVLVWRRRLLVDVAG
jgi:MFS family permease